MKTTTTELHVIMQNQSSEWNLWSQKANVSLTKKNTVRWGAMRIQHLQNKTTKLLPIFPGILLFTGASKGAPWWHTANELTLGVFVSTNIKRITSLHIIGALLGSISNVVFLLHEYTHKFHACKYNRGNMYEKPPINIKGEPHSTSTLNFSCATFHTSPPFYRTQYKF